jgi:hypothetical protein
MARVSTHLKLKAAAGFLKDKNAFLEGQFRAIAERFVDSDEDIRAKARAVA